MRKKNMNRDAQRVEQLGARVDRLARDLLQQRAIEDRTELNELIAERLILAKWQNSDGSPGNGYYLFHALLERAVKGPLYTPERAKILLPVLLAVNDEMDMAERDDRQDVEQQRKEQQQRKKKRAATRDRRRG